MSNKKISDIQVAGESDWSAKPYLTIDIDWAHDDVLADTIDLIENYDVPTTWFVTHETPLLTRLRGNPSFELGIHPNFNFLLNGDSRAGRDALEVVDRLMDIVPEAKSVRSHSTTQNAGLLDLFVRRGLTHECNAFIPVQANIALKPWQLWSDLVRVPYFWEDDVACLYRQKNTPSEMSDLINLEGIKVFNFHPVHIFLNTEHLDRYENTRTWHRSPEELITHRYGGEGTRTCFLEFLRLTSQAMTNPA